MNSADRPQVSYAVQAAETEIKNAYPTIRSHHLRFVGWAMGYGEVGESTGSPEAVAHWFTQKVETWVTSNDPYFRGYAEGTVGLNKEHSQEYESNLGAGLRAFIDASDEALFTIVEQVPDTIICGRMVSCGLGGHCPRRTAELPNGSLGLLDETGDTNIFIHVAKKSLGIELQIEDAVATSSDAPPQKVRKVTVTAGDIRRVLEFLAKEDAEASKIFKDYKGFYHDHFEEAA